MVSARGAVWCHGARGSHAVGLDLRTKPLPTPCRTRTGVPETDIIRVYDGYVAAYDYRTRNPKWVAEHITPASWSGEANRCVWRFVGWEPGLQAL